MHRRAVDQARRVYMVTVSEKADLSLVRLLAKKANDESYAEFICKSPFSFYIERVRRIGFVEKERVLDAGCGFGQWAAALALLNNRVTALERNSSRLAIAKEFTAKSGIDNIDFILGDAVSLPFDDSSFDAIFCYGVLMFLDRQKALKEFSRVLKPGGEIYVSTNAPGWWLRLWLQHLFGNRDVRSAAFVALMNGRRGGTPNSTSRADAVNILKSELWEGVEAAHEGAIRRSPDYKTPLSCYSGSFLGFDSVIEFVARKKTVDNTQILEERNEDEKKEAIFTLRRLVIDSVSKTVYEYITPLRRFPQPRPVRDLENNCFSEIIQKAVRQARSLDRVEQLRWIYQKITSGCQSEYERISSCLTFAQLHFFHHFAGQPTRAKGESVLDPIASAILRFGRCGHIARFLVDLFECNGIPARLLIGACHASAELLHRGRWVLADANLFPPGIYPVDASGYLVTTEQIIKSPFLLDRTPSYINYHHEYIEAFLGEYPETEPEIGRYLHAPMLPSSGYFGAEYFLGRTPGVIERLKKRGSPKEWNKDDNFGWGQDFERDVIQGPALPSRQRPGQVSNVYVKNRVLCWEKPFVSDRRIAVSYRLVASNNKRTWSYDQLPLRCNFLVSGQEIKTDDCYLPVEKLVNLGKYITFYAEVKEWQDENIFYLPSKEFDLEKL